MKEGRGGGWGWGEVSERTPDTDLSRDDVTAAPKLATVGAVSPWPP